MYYECVACIKSKQTRMIKIQKVSIGIEFNSATKSKEKRIKNLDERTFWHEIIYKSLIPTFGSLQ